ncbi:UNVERIFIED_CONTAM: hypothetical protein K2H54_050883 [Gekko kuhli]
MDSTVLEQWTMGAPVTADKSKGAEGEAWTRDSWMPLSTWAKPIWLLTPDLRSERSACDGTRRHYGCSFREEPEYIYVMEDTEAECLRREFRGEAEEIRREMQNMAIQREFWNHEWAPDGIGRVLQAPLQVPLQAPMLLPPAPPGVPAGPARPNGLPAPLAAPEQHRDALEKVVVNLHFSTLDNITYCFYNYRSMRISSSSIYPNAIKFLLCSMGNGIIEM